MNFLLFLILFIHNAFSLDLHLPGHYIESPYFEITKDIKFTQALFKTPTFIHAIVTYESKINDIIRRVFFYDRLIFHDESEVQPARRIVTYTVLPTTIVISIHPKELDKNSNENIYEAQFFITHDNMYDLANNYPTNIHIVNNHKRAVKEDNMRWFLSRKEFELNTGQSFFFNPKEYISEMFSFLRPERFHDPNKDLHLKDPSLAEKMLEAKEKEFKNDKIEEVDYPPIEEQEKKIHSMEEPSDEKKPEVEEEVHKTIDHGFNAVYDETLPFNPLKATLSSF